MLNFLEKFKLLNKNQFGFRPKKCTLGALVSFIGSIRQDWEVGIRETKAVFIDLKKAFDTVKHSILFGQTRQLGIERSHATFFEILSEQMAAMCNFRKCLLKFCRS